MGLSVRVSPVSQSAHLDYVVVQIHATSLRHNSTANPDAAVGKIEFTEATYVGHFPRQFHRRTKIKLPSDEVFECAKSTNDVLS